MEDLLKKQEDFEKTLAAQEEKFALLHRETLVEKMERMEKERLEREKEERKRAEEEERMRKESEKKRILEEVWAMGIVYCKNYCIIVCFRKKGGFY